MLIAVVSDSHSNYANIEMALERLRLSDVQHVFHCGDIADAQAAQMFCELPLSFVFGNVDSDLRGIEQAIKRSHNRCYGRQGECELAGRKIAFLHGDDRRARDMFEQSSRCDLLLYGHTHV